LAERQQQVKVEVPSGKDESVRFGRVGIIAVVGFAIGMVWPHLAGVKLVPSVPTPAAENSADLTGAPAAEGAAVTLPSAEPAPEEAKLAPRRVIVSEPQIAACRSKAGKRQESCDPVDFDRVSRAHLENLGQCEGSEDYDGVLSLGFDLDFSSERIKGIASGKSTSFEQKQVDTLLACAKKEFENVALTGIAHEHANYNLYYRVEFSKHAPAPPEEAPTPAGSAEPALEGDVTEASGRATVAWDVALIRSAPSRDGKVVARILSGTRVMVSGRRGDWYRIKYDAKGNQGWVYRTAIGM
jgi:Bacterial SH3 domain